MPQAGEAIFSPRSILLSHRPTLWGGVGGGSGRSPHCFGLAGTQSEFGVPLASLPAGAVLRQRTEQRLVNQKQYLEAKRLLKEFRARYRQLVRCSLRTVFRATAPPPGHPALSEGQPRFGRFLKFMDEFCQGPTASDSKD